MCKIKRLDDLDDFAWDIINYCDNEDDRDYIFEHDKYIHRTNFRMYNEFREVKYFPDEDLFDDEIGQDLEIHIYINHGMIIKPKYKDTVRVDLHDIVKIEKLEYKGNECMWIFYIKPKNYKYEGSEKRIMIGTRDVPMSQLSFGMCGYLYEDEDYLPDYENYDVL